MVDKSSKNAIIFKIEATDKSGITNTLEFETDWSDVEVSEDILRKVILFFNNNGLELPEEIEDILFE